MIFCPVPCKVEVKRLRLEQSTIGHASRKLNGAPRRKIAHHSAFLVSNLKIDGSLQFSINVDNRPIVLEDEILRMRKAGFSFSELGLNISRQEQSWRIIITAQRHTPHCPVSPETPWRNPLVLTGR